MITKTLFVNRRCVKIESKICIFFSNKTIQNRINNLMLFWSHSFSNILWSDCNLKISKIATVTFLAYFYDIFTSIFSAKYVTVITLSHTQSYVQTNSLYTLLTRWPALCKCVNCQIFCILFCYIPKLDPVTSLYNNNT